MKGPKPMRHSTLAILLLLLAALPIVADESTTPADPEKEIIGAYEAKLKAGNTSEKISSDIAIRELTVQQREIEVEAEYKRALIGRWYEPVNLLAYIIVGFVGKVVVWDTMLGLGSTPLFSGPAYGPSMLAAGVILAIMIVPYISAVSREVLMAVPRSQREAALALGATKWETIRDAVIPYARSGIVGGVILGLGRALGETMAVTMLIGNRHEISASYFGSIEL